MFFTIRFFDENLIGARKGGIIFVTFRLFLICSLNYIYKNVYGLFLINVDV